MNELRCFLYFLEFFGVDGFWGFWCFLIIFLVLQCSVCQYALAENYHFCAACCLPLLCPWCRETEQFLVTRSRLPYCFQPGKRAIQEGFSSVFVLYFKDMKAAICGGVCVSGDMLAYTVPRSS